MRYILVTGSVFSGVGKTVVSCSLAKMLQSHGVEATYIKIDSYLNAGNCSSLGEVFVLEDGCEVDVDLGTYERTLDVNLHAANHITTGKMYKDVMGKECCDGGYCGGRNVQVQPHFTDAFWNHVRKAAQIPITKHMTKTIPEVCIIELGGNVDGVENQPFVECFRQFRTTDGSKFCSVHVSHVPMLDATSELKTEPTLNSIAKLDTLGLSPDVIICRSQCGISRNEMEIISESSRVPLEQIVSLPDYKRLYKIPRLLKICGMADFLADRLILKLNQELDEVLGERCLRLDMAVRDLSKTVTVAVVGEYTEHRNRYPSIDEALFQVGLKADCRVLVDFIKPQDVLTSGDGIFDKYECVIVTSGGLGIHDIEGQVEASRICREKMIPFVGVGLGFHSTVVEMVRAFDPDLAEEVIIEIPEGSMHGNAGRCGKKKSVFKESCTSNLRLLYGNKMFFRAVKERHSSKYQINPKHLDILEQNGIRFVATDIDDKLMMDILELPEDVHPYFVACRFNPEYSTRDSGIPPAFLGMVLAAKNQLKSYLIDAGPRSITHTIFQNYKKTAEEERELELCNHVTMSHEQHGDMMFEGKVYTAADFLNFDPYQRELQDQRQHRRL